jgi:hypothetical protein
MCHNILRNKLVWGEVYAQIECEKFFTPTQSLDKSEVATNNSNLRNFLHTCKIHSVVMQMLHKSLWNTLFVI